MSAHEADVLVIGAGVAGIAAARALRMRGLACVVLEAKPRIGGRAFTDATGFDHGASWLHQANDNPLTPLAEALGFEMVDHDKLRQRLLFTEGRFASPAERRAFAVAEDHFWRVIEAAATDGAPDRPASHAAPSQCATKASKRPPEGAACEAGRSGAPSVAAASITRQK